ncbi:MAG: hypothetical protein AAGD05_06095 [Bacteroidota bacterium]
MSDKTLRKIKSVHTYFITEDHPEGGILSGMQLQDEQGNLLRDEQYNFNGDLEQKIERHFDAENRLLEEKHYTSEKEPHQVITHTYHPEGKLANSKVQYQSGAHSITQYEYDLAAKQETITTLDEKGQIEEKIVLQFDNEGRVLEETQFGADGVFEQKVTASYTEAGRPLEKTFQQGEEPAYTHYFDYEFDEEGRVNYAEVFDVEEDLIRTDEIDYDEQGNRVEVRMKHYANGWSVIDRYDYDEQRRVVKEERLQGDGQPLEIKEYRYNADNLVEEEEVRDRAGIRINRFAYTFFS